MDPFANYGSEVVGRGGAKNDAAVPNASDGKDAFELVSLGIPNGTLWCHAHCAFDRLSSSAQHVASHKTQLGFSMGLIKHRSSLISLPSPCERHWRQCGDLCLHLY